MTALTVQDVSRRSGLSEPTLRYYEEVGLIGPIERDPSSRHRRYRDEDLDTLQALACLRAMGVGIEDMRTYKDSRVRGHEAAAEQPICCCAMSSGSRLRSRRYGHIWTICGRRRRCGTPATAGMATRRPRRTWGCRTRFPGWKRWCCDEPGVGYRGFWLCGHAVDRCAATGRSSGAGDGSVPGARGRCACGGASR